MRAADSEEKARRPLCSEPCPVALSIGYMSMPMTDLCMNASVVQVPAHEHASDKMGWLSI